MFNWISRMLGSRPGPAAASPNQFAVAGEEAGYREAIRLFPGREDSHIALCMMLVGQQRLPEALQLVEQGLQHVPGSVGLHVCQGNLLHALGRLAEAAEVFRKALALDPGNPALRNNLGLVLLQLQDGLGAMSVFMELHLADPESPEPCHNLGIACLAAGDLPQAITFLQRAVALAPASARAHGDLANALLASEQPEQSIAYYAAALELDPGLGGSLHRQFAAALRELGQFQAAAEQYQAALPYSPDDPDLHVDLGTALHALGRHDDALACYQQALALDPANVVAQFNTGVTWRDLAEQAEAKSKPALMEQAAAAYRAALAIDGSHVETLNNLGNLLQECGDFDAAVPHYERILSIEPDKLSARTNLGLCFETAAKLVRGQAKADRMALAILHYQSALALDPGHTEAMIGIASILGTQMRIDEALAMYERILAIEPGAARARMNRGMLRLLKGELADGWADYEERHRYKLSPVLQGFAQPMWDGTEALAGKTIFLCADQGMGDTIQFMRYIDLVRSRKPAAIYLEVQEPLQSLMQALPDVSLVDRHFGTLPPFDTYCPVVSLPHAFGTTLETIPPVAPYLAAPPARKAFWGERLKEKRDLRIGLVWSGNPDFANDQTRSVPLQTMLPLLDEAGMHFFSLQKQVRETDLAVLGQTNNITHLGPELRDFAETAAAIANLDLVISVDTAVAHLAGSLSVPIWIMLPFCNDFRWLVGRPDTPWYPTARLFRQPTLDDWGSVIAALKAALRSEAGKARPVPSAT